MQAWLSSPNSLPRWMVLLAGTGGLVGVGFSYRELKHQIQTNKWQVANEAKETYFYRKRGKFPSYAEVHRLLTPDYVPQDYMARRDILDFMDYLAYVVRETDDEILAERFGYYINSVLNNAYARDQLLCNPTGWTQFMKIARASEKSQRTTKREKVGLQTAQEFLKTFTEESEKCKQTNKPTTAKKDEYIIRCPAVKRYLAPPPLVPTTPPPVVAPAKVP